ncbi:MAG: DUF1853 family protein [Flavobacteriales bacterium]|nr:DUF1853 family protein [Flavobacteriales bacterium]
MNRSKSENDYEVFVLQVASLAAKIVFRYILSAMKANGYFNKWVRDLFWVLSSPPLLGVEAFPKHATPHLFPSEIELELLDKLDQLPHDIEQTMKSLYHLPTGKIFEKLLLYWFSTSPRWNCEAHGVQLNQHNQTIGELDFIVQDRDLNQTWHLEVACKFYLSASNNKAWNTWIGPNPTDTLELKKKKLENQTRAILNPVAKEFLEKRHIAVSHSGIILKGYFFHYWKDVAFAKPPTHAHPAYCSGLWCHQSEVEQVIGNPEQWTTLNRDSWFAPLLAQDWQPYSIELGQKPVLLARLAQGQMGFEEDLRLFVVPNDWPNH